MNEKATKLAKYGGRFSDQETFSIDFATLLDTLINNRWLISTVAAAITALGTLYALVATPIYDTNLLVQVEDTQGSSANLLGDLANAFELKSAATAEIEILRSRFIVSRAIKNAKLNLTVKPHYFPLIGSWVANRNNAISEPGLFGMGGFLWGSERASISTFDLPNRLHGEPFVLTATGHGKYRLTNQQASIDIPGKIGENVSAITPYGQIYLRVDRLESAPGGKFTITHSNLLEATERLQRRLVIAERGKQSGVIGISLEGDDASKIATTLNEIGKVYIKQNIERKSAEAEKSLEFLEKQLPLLKTNLEAAESKYNALRNIKGTVDLGEEAKALLQQSILSKSRQLELRQKRDELLTRYQPSNPIVEAITQQLDTSAREMEVINNKIKSMPSVEQELLRLTRDVKVNTDLYTSLLNSAQQLRLVKASKVGNVRILDEAVIPLHAVKPMRLVIVVLSILAGLTIGVLCAFIKKSLFAGIEDPHEIEELLGMTVSATIPFSDKQALLYNNVREKKKALSVLAVSDPRDSAIESLRSFRTSLQFSLASAKNNIVMITGSTPGIGKSFISVNVAAVLASGGKKVLLIDADIRKGYLNSYFGIERSGGLSDMLSNSLEAVQVKHVNVIENLDFIGTGALPARPAELLSCEDLKSKLNDLSSQYDYVVIDTAPILAVTDALIIAPHVGRVFCVARSEHSTIGEIEETAKRLDGIGSSVTGIIFNGIKPQLGRYAYGSKYGKYRYEEYSY